MCASAAEDLPSLPDCLHVVAKAKERLQMASYMPVREVSCEYDDGVLILRGQVSSFLKNSLPRKLLLSSTACGRWRIWLRSWNVRTMPREATVGAKYYLYAIQCGDPEEKRRWLKKAAKAGHIPAMSDYGLECEDRPERRRWLREAAYEGHAPAIYRYGLECSDPRERKHWLRQAAETGDVEAMYTYSQECEDSTEAEYWLRKTACEGHIQAMYDYAMQCNDLKERRRWLKRAANQGWEVAVEALEALD